MLTTLFLLSLSTATVTASHACESSAVERPGLELALPSWGFIVRPETACEASTISAADLYRLGIDPAAPVEVDEYTGDIYQDDDQ